MSKRTSRSSLSLVLAAVAASLLSALGIPGCNVSSASPNRTAVWGRVVYNGRPIDSGVIVFMPAERGKSNWGAGRIDAGGRFSLSAYQAETGLEPGNYDIFFKPPAGNLVAAGASRAADDVQDPKRVQAAPFSLPEKYTNPKTSGLEFVFDGRPQQIDLELKD
jgi:hypothetical protein